ncbi:hypothetical protein [Algoriphagus vanfongensis]|nr:hypothetical protein [Algoriphagus vanfongensis]
MKRPETTTEMVIAPPKTMLVKLPISPPNTTPITSEAMPHPINFPWNPR